jgi:abequosyltransferase
MDGIPQLTQFKLSICITTFNRAEFIGATLESLITQATGDCEIVIVDGGSTDGTDRVVAEYMERFPHLTYVRQENNGGFDRDLDRAVEIANGEYCWLMSDDDALKPGALKTVLDALRSNYSLVVVNSEAVNFDMSTSLQRSMLDIKTDRRYGPTELDTLFREVGGYMVFVGCLVIKREIWRSRDRGRYYGSLFIHTGVVFQEPMPDTTLVMAEPLIRYRRGTPRAWWSSGFEVFTVKYPAVVKSLALSESTVRMGGYLKPWANVHSLIVFRALGLYSLTEYRTLVRPRTQSPVERLPPLLIALTPGLLVNSLYSLYCRFWSRHPFLLGELRSSPFHLRNYRLFA